MKRFLVLVVRMMIEIIKELYFYLLNPRKLGRNGFYRFVWMNVRNIDYHY